MRRHFRAFDPTRSGLRRVLPSTLLIGSLLASSGGAQETESPLSPAGRLRLEIAPTFTAWDSRFGLRMEGGSLVEETEPLGLDLAGGDPAAFFPGVAGLETRLRELLADPELEGVLGTSGAVVSADRVTIPFRLDLGVFHRLTVGVMVPLVKNRTEVDFAFQPDDDANLGANPAVTDPAEVATWFEGLDGAATAVDARADELCDESPTSGACLSTRELADDLAGFSAGIAAAYGASWLFPVQGSNLGDDLAELADDLGQRLVNAGFEDLASLPLGDALPDREALDAFVRNAYSTEPLRDRVGIWELGDIEVHAAVRLLEGARRDSAGAPADMRWQVGAGGLVRLGTGSIDDPAVALDRGAGDGQTDVEGRLFANLTVRRFGLWADARYGVQMPVTLFRRVGPPDVVLIAPSSRSAVEWTPGNYLQLEVAPRYHLTDELAFSAGYRLWSKAEDVYERVSPEPQAPAQPYIPPGAFFTDVSLLALETEETRHEVGAGMVYNTLDAWAEGRAPLPLEARVTLRWAVAGSGGMTPDIFQARVGVRLYWRLWGD